MSYQPSQPDPQPPKPGGDTPLRQSTNIQGNILAAFNKDHVRFLFVGLDAGAARAWLGEVEPLVANTKEVEDFNENFSKLQKANGGADPEGEHAKWIGLGLTVDGLRKLTTDEERLTADLQQFGAFVAKAPSRAGQVGDAGPSAPEHWLFGAESQPAIDAIVTVAADRPEDLEALRTEIVAINGRHGASLVFEQTGETLPGPGAGHEHFGFKDGISQPGVTQFHQEDPAHPGKRLGHPDQDLIAPGEFVLGYPDQEKKTADVPAWMHDGSFQVYRRLAQDVPGFWSGVEQQQKAHLDGVVDSETLAAKLVGRWRSGASLSHHPDKDPDLQPSDPDDNEFDFQADDADGLKTPRCAHIRKVYPRDATPPGDTESERRRILRRGIAFGAPFIPAFGAGTGAGDARGLNFVCFQASIEAKFEFLQQSWADNADFPAGSDGPDPIIGKNDAGTPVTLKLKGQDHTVTMARFVTTQASVYAFNPSKQALVQLADGS
ncbi:MAG: Dyp-type peroxidase [Solirubrobacteraceae bacterium]